MLFPPHPANEMARLEALQEYEILDTSPEECFDDFTSLAAHLCESPISLISLLDSDRQWFKSKVGIDADSTPREISFCGHAILNPGEVMVVGNALEDERFHDNPLVTGAPDIRFYAGTPLVNPTGCALGTLCVIDYQPRDLSDCQRDALERLGRRVVAQLELRRVSVQLASALEKVRTLEGLLPICSHCKSIRDDSGYWSRLEEYVAENTEARFTHGICPVCTDEHFAEMQEAELCRDAT